MLARDQAEPLVGDGDRSADSMEFRQYIFNASHGESADGSSESLIGEMPQVQLCLLSCCPCLLGNPCSASRRDEYSKAMRSFCFLISIVHVIMMVVALAIPPGPHVVPFFTNPSVGPGDNIFVLLGAKITCKILVNGQFWRFLTPMYLHAGILHLLFNLYGQLRIGLYLENRWGWIKLTFVYFTSGIGGTLAGAVFQPSNISVGATACLMGLMGAYLAEIFCLWNRMEKNQRSMSLLQIVGIIVVALLLGIAPLIDVSSHIGGLTCGLLVGLSYSSLDLPQEWQRRVLPLLSVCVLIALFVAGTVEFYLFTTPPTSSFCPL